ncbi:branched-chain amino acid ABC transporter permease [Pontimicrobium sp. MEBiC06410]
MNYYLHILIFIEIYCILALSLNMQLGLSRIVNLAIATFYGLGAYTYAILNTKFNLSFIPILIISLVINIVFSLFISIASRKFKDEIFVLVSLSFQMIMYSVLWNWESVTGGVNGIANITGPIILGFRVKSQIEFTLFGSILLILSIGLSLFIHHSAFSRTLKAIRDNEIAAATLGKNIYAFKTTNIAISCALASLSGILFASYIGYIDATSFSINESIDILFILLIGGLLSTKGAIIGVILFFTLEEVFKSIGFNDDISFNLRIILFSITIIFILYKRPNGLFGKYSIE